MTQTIPNKICKYEIIKEIGRGSMGVVYLGFDPYINRSVAIKIALRGSQESKEDNIKYRKLFFNEARIAGMLDHSNILPIYDAGVDGEQYYIATEYIKDSKTLKEYCKIDDLLPINKILEIIFQCCKALEYAHKRGVIHRDIKPSNIMLTEEMEAKIGDFGLAQANKSDMTQLIGLVGSPSYMSPEQANDEKLTNQTDLFSLGIVMYELMAGRLPFQGDSIPSLIYKIINEDPLPIRNYRQEVSKGVENILMKALNKKTKGRYSMGLEFAADLTKIFQSLEYQNDKIDVKEKFNILKKLTFFKEFLDSEIWEVLHASVWEEYPPDQRIITEGELENTFYIIASGKVLVKKGSKSLVSISSGDCFGEIGYLSKKKRTANVTSLTDVTLIKISSAQIDYTSQECQLRFNKVFLKTLIERLIIASENISKPELH